MSPRPRRHGTFYSYRHGCRCPACAGVVRAYYVAYRKLRRERGQCTQCTRPALPDRSLCTAHLAKDRRRAAEVKHALACHI